MSDMTPLEVALMVADITGYRVFPSNQLKKPCVKDPYGHSTNEKEGIRELFGNFPNAMTAIPTGSINGITVVDLDVKGGVNGIESLRGLIHDLPPTMVVRTPSGGAHLFFRTGSENLPSSVGKLGPGIDIRGSGSNAISFGSVSEKGMYRWDHTLSGFTWRPAPMPPDLKKLIYAAAPSGRAQMGGGQSYNRSDVGNRLTDPIVKGSRNDQFASRIGYLLKIYTPQEVYDLAHHMNKTLTTEPLDRKEVDTVFCSILKRELRK
jgi:hypothetical protein